MKGKVFKRDFKVLCRYTKYNHKNIEIDRNKRNKNLTSASDKYSKKLLHQMCHNRANQP